MPPRDISSENAIGIFDSGVGGLSILREIRAALPAERLLYIADQAHVPYGPRPIEEVRGFVFGLARFLIEQNAKLIVVACNTASAAALRELRAAFPDMPFVGMEPAVKPAARDTQTGVIGVIATQATFQGALYESVVGRFAQHAQVEARACPEFVTLVEAGETNTPAARDAVRRCMEPLLRAGIDQLVLGCTHFPFLKDTIQAEVGSGVTIVDPSPAIARQTERVLAARDLLRNMDAPGCVTYYTSGDVDVFATTLRTLSGESGEVHTARWAGDQLVAEFNDTRED